MLPKILTGVALAFSVIALIIKLVAVSVPHFVDVHLVADSGDVADANNIAGVGVYQSIFDPTGDDIVDIAAAEGLPIIKIESGTTDFVLLFPAQLNFQAQLLPLDADAVANLDATVGANGILVAAFAGVLDELENLEFENCAAYGAEARDLNTQYFEIIEDDVLPNAISFITFEISTDLNAGLVNLTAGIQDASAAPALFIEPLILGALAGAAAQDANCATIDLTVDITFDALTQACLTAAIPVVTATIGPQSGALLDLVFRNLQAVDGGNGNTVINAQILQLLQGTIVTAGGTMGDAPVFAVSNLNPTCGAVLGAFNCTTKAEWLEFVELLILENFDATNEQLVLALGAVVGFNNLFTQTDVVDDDTLFGEELLTVPVDAANSALLATFNIEGYQPCDVLNAFDALQPQFDIFGGDGPCSTVRDFLPGVAATLAAVENELAPLVAGIVGLYQSCDEGGELLGNPIGTFCVEEVFAPGLLGATPGVDPGQTFDADFVDACEDDNTDREAVETAQVLVGLSAALNVLTVIVIIVSFFVLSTITGPIAAVTAVVGGIFIIAGLLVVQGAPVYDGVGVEPEDGELDTFFVAGYVGLLALVDAVLCFLAAIILIVSAVLTCRSTEGESDYDDEKKGEVAMEDQL